MDPTSISPLQLAEKIQHYVNWNLDNLYKSGDPDLLFQFIKSIFGFQIPRNKVCAEHVAPFDFVADSFFDKESKFLVIANRNGGKTQNFGILNALDATCKKNCEIASVGAIEDQARKAYKYTIDIIKKPYFKHLLEEEPKMSITKLANGSEISILPGTMAGVNGPHPQKTNFDEVELTQWKILMEFMSMAKSTKDVPSTVRITSTRKFPYGPMQRLIDEKDDRQFKLYMWCIWETIEPCSDERSGTVPTKITVPDPKSTRVDTYTVYSHNKEDFDKEYPIDYVRKNREKLTGCLACPLVEVCHTKAKRSDGYYSIRDAIDKFTGMDRYSWDTQWECKKPGTEGLVYAEFDELINVIPKSSFKFNPNYPVVAGQDFGYNDPSATVFIQFLPNGDAVIFDELYINRTQTPVLLHKYWLPKYYKYKPWAWYCDPENADAISQMESAGIPVYPAIKDIELGIEKVRTWIKNADGYTRLYITSNCINTIQEFKSYRYPDPSDTRNSGNKPLDKNNHAMDALRYVIHSMDNGTDDTATGFEVELL